MDIPHKLFQISIFLTQNGLVTVLENMAMAVITTLLPWTEVWHGGERPVTRLKVNTLK
jgi:hypothetical protein